MDTDAHIATSCIEFLVEGLVGVVVCRAGCGIGPMDILEPARFPCTCYDRQLDVKGDIWV